MIRLQLYRCIFAVVLLFVQSQAKAQQPFVYADNSSLHDSGGSVFVCKGVSMWYAPLLASEGKRQRTRLITELDSLHTLGVNTVSILAGASVSLPESVDSLRPSYGVLHTQIANEKLLRGLDFVLCELQKRKMKAVISLDREMPFSEQYVEKYKQFAAHLLKRKNSLSSNLYSNDSTILAWRVCDALMTQNADSLYRFVAVESELASYLKTLDKNHLVSISYMPLGTQDNEPFFETCVQAQDADVIEVVANPVITCGVKNGNLFDNLGNVYLRTDDRIEIFNRLSLNYGKVYWLADACYPRDAFFVRPSSRTDARNAYFAYLLSKVEEAKLTGQPLVGCSFKGWGGMARTEGDEWRAVYDYTAEYPECKKGVYSIFSNDVSTTTLLRHGFRFE